jgi:hypothetical protein
MRTLYSMVAVVGLGVASATLASNAKAADWSVGVGVGVPGVVVSAAPVYVPPPRYYEPAPVYAPGYYYARPRYYRPPVVIDGDDYYRHREWEWRHHHHHHHDDDD